MAFPWDSLSQAANVMQVTGVDAFGLVSMIAQAAHTARRNIDLCHQLRLHVLIVGDLLRTVDIPELRRHPETCRPLDQLNAILVEAYDLVRSCAQQQQNTSHLYQILTGASVACKLRQVQERIDRYINLIPMITLAGQVNFCQGRDEGDKDMSNAAASNQRRARLSLQDDANASSVALEELPPRGETVGSREESPQVLVLSQQWPSKSTQNGGLPTLLNGVTPEPHLSEVRHQLFNYDELSRSTHGFSLESNLGSGCFYRGFLPGSPGLNVAIKRITITESIKFDQMRILGQLRHPNLVQFLGWSLGERKDEALFVYELLENGSLDTHLNSSQNTLTWAIRHKIILGMGDALLYMPQDLLLNVSIKPSNVMLDPSFNAKLGDFPLDGCRRDYCDSKPGFGYLDPVNVYLDTTAAAVYSFGVMVLEITCGRRPWDSMPIPVPDGEEESSDDDDDEIVCGLVPWVRALYERRQGAILDAADPRLGGDFEAPEVERALTVGLWCTHPDSSSRPSIGQAMDVLRHPEEPLPVRLQVPPATATSPSREPATSRSRTLTQLLGAGRRGLHAGPASGRRSPAKSTAASSRL